MKRGISLTLILSLFLTQCFPVSAQPLPLPPVVKPSPAQPLLSTLGTFKPALRSSSKQTLIHVQDVHLNDDAQKNIGALLGNFVHNKKVDLIALEGAFGPIDLSTFRSLSDQNALRIAADYLLKTKKLSGPIYMGLTANEALPPIIGIDDQVHYEKNVEAYRASAKIQPETLKNLHAERARLETEAAAVFNPELAAFHALVRSHETEKISIGEYIAQLSQRDDDFSPNAALFVEALALERKLNFERVKAEQARLIGILAGHLGPELDTLRSGELKPAEFCRLLSETCVRAKVPLAAFPAFRDYIQYIQLSDGIDGAALLDEAAALEKKVYRRLAQSESETTLIDQFRNLYLTEKLVRFELSKREWNELKTSHANIACACEDFKSFYREAEIRDQKMSENLTAAMAKTGAKNVVVVTGGFHTLQVPTPIITFTPTITRIDNGSSYLSVFTREKTPFEKIFHEDKLFLSPKIWTKPLARDLSSLAQGQLILVNPDSGIVIRKISFVEGAISNVRDWAIDFRSPWVWGPVLGMLAVVFPLAIALVPVIFGMAWSSKDPKKEQLSEAIAGVVSELEKHLGVDAEKLLRTFRFSPTLVPRGFKQSIGNIRSWQLASSQKPLTLMLDEYLLGGPDEYGRPELRTALLHFAFTHLGLEGMAKASGFETFYGKSMVPQRWEFHFNLADYLAWRYLLTRAHEIRMDHERHLVAVGFLAALRRLWPVWRSYEDIVNGSLRNMINADITWFNLNQSEIRPIISTFPLTGPSPQEVNVSKAVSANNITRSLTQDRPSPKWSLAVFTTLIFLSFILPLDWHVLTFAILIGGVLSPETIMGRLKMIQNAMYSVIDEIFSRKIGVEEIIEGLVFKKDSIQFGNLERPYLRPWELRDPPGVLVLDENIFSDYGLLVDLHLQEALDEMYLIYASKEETGGYMHSKKTKEFLKAAWSYRALRVLYITGEGYSVSEQRQDLRALQLLKLLRELSEEWETYQNVLRHQVRAQMEHDIWEYRQIRGQVDGLVEEALGDLDSRPLEEDQISPKLKYQHKEPFRMFLQDIFRDMSTVPWVVPAILLCAFFPFVGIPVVFMASAMEPHIMRQRLKKIADAALEAIKKVEEKFWPSSEKLLEGFSFSFSTDDIENNSFSLRNGVSDALIRMWHPAESEIKFHLVFDNKLFRSYPRETQVRLREALLHAVLYHMGYNDLADKGGFKLADDEFLKSVANYWALRYLFQESHKLDLEYDNKMNLAYQLLIAIHDLEIDWNEHSMALPEPLKTQGDLDIARFRDNKLLNIAYIKALNDKSGYTQREFNEKKLDPEDKRKLHLATQGIVGYKTGVLWGTLGLILLVLCTFPAGLIFVATTMDGKQAKELIKRVRKAFFEVFAALEDRVGALADDLLEGFSFEPTITSGITKRRIRMWEYEPNNHAMFFDTLIFEGESGEVKARLYEALMHAGLAQMTFRQFAVPFIKIIRRKPLSAKESKGYEEFFERTVHYRALRYLFENVQELQLSSDSTVRVALQLLMTIHDLEEDWSMFHARIPSGLQKQIKKDLKRYRRKKKAVGRFLESLLRQSGYDWGRFKFAYILPKDRNLLVRSAYQIVHGRPSAAWKNGAFALLPLGFMDFPPAVWVGGVLAAIGAWAAIKLSKPRPEPISSSYLLRTQDEPWIYTDNHRQLKTLRGYIHYDPETGARVRNGSHEYYQVLDALFNPRIFREAPQVRIRITDDKRQRVPIIRTMRLVLISRDYIGILGKLAVRDMKLAQSLLEASLAHEFKHQPVMMKDHANILSFFIDELFVSSFEVLMIRMLPEGRFDYLMRELRRLQTSNGEMTKEQHKIIDHLVRRLAVVRKDPHVGKRIVRAIMRQFIESEDFSDELKEQIDYMTNKPFSSWVDLRDLANFREQLRFQSMANLLMDRIAITDYFEPLMRHLRFVGKKWTAVIFGASLKKAIKEEKKNYPEIKKHQRRVLDATLSSLAASANIRPPEEGANLLIYLNVLPGFLAGTALALYYAAMGEMAWWMPVVLPFVGTVVTFIAHEAWHLFFNIYHGATIILDRRSKLSTAFQIQPNDRLPAGVILLQVSGFLSVVPMYFLIGLFQFSYPVLSVIYVILFTVNGLSMVPMQTILGRDRLKSGTDMDIWFNLFRVLRAFYRDGMRGAEETTEQIIGTEVLAVREVANRLVQATPGQLPFLVLKFDRWTEDQKKLFFFSVMTNYEFREHLALKIQAIHNEESKREVMDAFEKVGLHIEETRVDEVPAGKGKVFLLILAAIIGAVIITSVYGLVWLWGLALASITMSQKWFLENIPEKVEDKKKWVSATQMLLFLRMIGKRPAYFLIQAVRQGREFLDKSRLASRAEVMQALWGSNEPTILEVVTSLEKLSHQKKQKSVKERLLHLLILDPDRIPHLGSKPVSIAQAQQLLSAHLDKKSYEEMAKFVEHATAADLRAWFEGDRGAAGLLKQALEPDNSTALLQSRTNAFDEETEQLLAPDQSDDAVLAWIDKLGNWPSAASIFYELSAFMAARTGNAPLAEVYRRVADAARQHEGISIDSPELTKMLVDSIGKHKADNAFMSHAVIPPFVTGALTPAWVRSPIVTSLLFRVIDPFQTTSTQQLSDLNWADGLMILLAEEHKRLPDSPFLRDVYDRLVERVYAPIKIIPEEEMKKRRTKNIRVISENERHNITKIKLERNDHLRRLEQQDRILFVFLRFWPEEKIINYIVNRYPYRLKSRRRPHGLDIETLVSLAHESLAKVGYYFEEKPYMTEALAWDVRTAPDQDMISFLQQRVVQLDAEIHAAMKADKPARNRSLEREFVSVALTAYWEAEKKNYEKAAELMVKAAVAKDEFNRSVVKTMFVEYFRRRLQNEWDAHKARLRNLKEVNLTEEAHEFIEQTREPSPTQVLLQAQGIIDRSQPLLRAGMNDTEYAAVRLKGGFDPRYESVTLSFEDIGKIVGMTRQAIQQAFVRGVDKLGRALWDQFIENMWRKETEKPGPVSVRVKQADAPVKLGRYITLDGFNDFVGKSLFFSIDDAYPEEATRKNFGQPPLNNIFIDVTEKNPFVEKNAEPVAVFHVQFEKDADGEIKQISYENLMPKPETSAPLLVWWNIVPGLVAGLGAAIYYWWLGDLSWWLAVAMPAVATIVTVIVHEAWHLVIGLLTTTSQFKRVIRVQLSKSWINVDVHGEPRFGLYGKMLSLAAFFSVIPLYFLVNTFPSPVRNIFLVVALIINGLSMFPMIWLTRKPNLARATDMDFIVLMVRMLLDPHWALNEARQEVDNMLGKDKVIAQMMDKLMEATPGQLPTFIAEIKRLDEQEQIRLSMIYKDEDREILWNKAGGLKDDDLKLTVFMSLLQLGLAPRDAYALFEPSEERDLEKEREDSFADEVVAQQMVKELEASRPEDFLSVFAKINGLDEYDQLMVKGILYPEHKRIALWEKAQKIEDSEIRQETLTALKELGFAPDAELFDDDGSPLLIWWNIFPGLVAGLGTAAYLNVPYVWALIAMTVAVIAHEAWHMAWNRSFEIKFSWQAISTPITDYAPKSRALALGAFISGFLILIVAALVQMSDPYFYTLLTVVVVINGLSALPLAYWFGDYLRIPFTDMDRILSLDGQGRKPFEWDWEKHFDLLEKIKGKSWKLVKERIFQRLETLDHPELLLQTVEEIKSWNPIHQKNLMKSLTNEKARALLSQNLENFDRPVKPMAEALSELPDAGLMLVLLPETLKPKELERLIVDTRNKDRIFIAASNQQVRLRDLLEKHFPRGRIDVVINDDVFVSNYVNTGRLEHLVNNHVFVQAYSHLTLVSPAGLNIDPFGFSAGSLLYGAWLVLVKDGLASVMTLETLRERINAARDAQKSA